MTTDTHVVSARLLIERGYHPVGEAMDWDLLASYVREALTKALETMRPARLKWALVKAQGLKVFGAEQLKKLCEVPADIVVGAKKAAKKALLPAFVFLLILAFLL